MTMSSQAERELRFVAVDGQKSRSSSDRRERRSVRAFVMRDYLRQKSDPTWKFTPAKVADHITSHISRFRSARPASIPRPRKRKLATTRERTSQGKSRTQRLLVPAPAAAEETSSSLSSPHDLDDIDPFGTLPIDLSNPDTKSLMQYYQTAFWANSYACNPEARWISTAMMDPAMIHATLSLVAIHRRDRFSLDLSKVYFKHRGEAMKIVAQRLSNMDESLSDGTIGAVALLSSSDNHFDWPSDTQATHSRGLGHLIAMRGGMGKLSSNRQIQRVAGWADLLQSAMHGTSLQVEMPAAVQEASAESVDQGITSAETEELPLGIVLQDLPSDTRDMLRQLRILSSLKVSLLDERNEELCRTFSNLLWQLEYSILDHSEQKRGHSRPDQRGARPDFGLLSNVTGIAVLIFSYLTLRDLAAPILYRKLGNRLQKSFTTMMISLQSSGNEYLTESMLATVLWSLFLGWQGSRKDSKVQAWFIDQTAQLCWRHGILSHETIRARIQSVIPQAHSLLNVPEEFWILVEGTVWSDMLSLQDPALLSM